MQSVKEMRIRAGKTQDEMSLALGVSRPTYIKFESNPETMTLQTAKRLCELLNCSINDLFFIDSVRTD